MYRITKSRVSSAVAAGLLTTLVLGSVALADTSSEETTYTGCLTTRGSLTKVAAEDEPLRRCNRRETQVQWTANQAQVDDLNDRVAALEALLGDGGPLGYYTVNSENVAVAPGTVGTATAVCDAGDPVTGGGVDAGGAADVVLFDSFPPDSSSWEVSIINTGTLGINIGVTAYARCADIGS